MPPKSSARFRPRLENLVFEASSWRGVKFLRAPTSVPSCNRRRQSDSIRVRRMDKHTSGAENSPANAANLPRQTPRPFHGRGPLLQPSVALARGLHRIVADELQGVPNAERAARANVTGLGAASSSGGCERWQRKADGTRQRCADRCWTTPDIRTRHGRCGGAGPREATLHPSVTSKLFCAQGSLRSASPRHAPRP